jgi:hypothetical protein
MQLAMQTLRYADVLPDVDSQQMKVAVVTLDRGAV